MLPIGGACRQAAKWSKDTLLGERAQGYLLGEQQSHAAHRGSMQASRQRERGYPARESELRATHRGSKETVLPLGEV